MEREDYEVHRRRETVMKPSACPRCNSTAVEKAADSPVKGKWEIYRCEECNFVWRSTEDLTGIDKRIEYLRKTAARIWD
jgi:transposase-like protein